MQVKGRRNEENKRRKRLESQVRHEGRETDVRRETREGVTPTHVFA